MAVNTPPSQDIILNEGEPSPLHRCLLYLTYNKQYLLWGFLALVLVLTLLYRFTGVQAKSQEVYSQVEAYFMELRENPTDANRVLVDLDSILRNHPDLRSKYEGDIAFVLLQNGQNTKALPYIEATLKRTEPLFTGATLPLYSHFSKTALFLARDELTLALNDSEKLQSKLDSLLAAISKKTPFLESLNLIRIASLQKQNGLFEAELKTWDKLLLKSSWVSQEDSPVLGEYADLQRLWKEKNISLLDYIQAQKVNK